MIGVVLTETSGESGCTDALLLIDNRIHVEGGVVERHQPLGHTSTYRMRHGIDGSRPPDQTSFSFCRRGTRTDHVDERGGVVGFLWVAA